MSVSGRWYFVKFSNTLVLPDPEPSIIKTLKPYDDGREYKANLGCDLFWLIYHNYPSFFSRCYNFNKINISFLLESCFIFQRLMTKIFIDDEVKDFVVINSGEYSKCTRGKLHSKLSEEQNLRKAAESLYIFLTTPDEV